MKDFKVLKFLDKFKGFFEKFDIDYEVMRKILQVKLIMDGRRIPTITNSSAKEKEDKDENNFIKSLWVYVLIGIVIIPMTGFGDNYIFEMSFVFGILMFMITTTLISDFSSVLLDIRDKNIIFSKPVDSKTLNMAKTVHILIYMFFITFSISGLALIVSLIRHGIVFFLIFLFEIILIDLFIVVLTALLYLVILKFFDGEKLKDIINYVQIALSIAMSLGYQLIGRLFSFVNLKVQFDPKWWQYFIVPVWFGAPFELVLKGNHNINIIVFSILSVLVPVLSIIIYIGLMPAFERNLQKLNNNSARVQNGSKGLFNKLIDIVSSNKEERAFFKFAWNIMKNEREFKLKVYPSLGFALVFPFIFIFNELRDKQWSSIASSKMYLNIYFCAILLPTVVMMMKYSEKYKGAWIYKVISTANISSIFKGTLKAFIVKMIIPLYAIDCIIFIAMFGLRIFPDLIAVFLNLLLFTVICFKFMKKALPFSKGFQATDQQGEGLIIIPLMTLLGVLVAIHYGCTLISYGIYLYIGVLILMVIVAWRKAFDISMENV